jgi:hypothetical protein
VLEKISRCLYKFDQADQAYDWCKTKCGEKAEHTKVCEHFELHFDAASAASADL